MTTYEENKEEKIIKKVTVETISTKDKTTLVKYMDGDTLCKVYIPTVKIVAGKVDEDVLGKGVQYGLPWDKVEFPKITGSALADELHKHNIWTAEEYRSNPNGVRAAINQLYGKPLAILNDFVHQENINSVGGK